MEHKLPFDKFIVPVFWKPRMDEEMLDQHIQGWDFFESLVFRMFLHYLPLEIEDQWYYLTCRERPTKPPMSSAALSPA